MNRSVKCSLGEKRCIWIIGLYFILYLFVLQMLIVPAAAEHFGRTGADLSQLLGMVLILFAAAAVCGTWLIRERDDFRKRRRFCLVLSLKYYGAMCAATLLLTFVLAGILAEPSAAQKADEALMRSGSVSFLFGAAVFAPFMEELVFRVSMIRLISKRFGMPAGLVLNALIFGLLHIVSMLPAVSAADLGWLVIYCGLGLILSLAYVRSGSMFASVSAHILYNLTAMIMMML
ncbi:MAG: CPBP family intramembrane metalloprotease [Solobacterium sp.]|nr:CPBP family intramembrane metalloprotease [Solobacterium sp.]